MSQVLETNARLNSVHLLLIHCTIYLHYMYQIKTFFVPKQTAKTCHILVIVGDRILKKKKMKLPIVMIVLKYFYCIFCNLLALKMSNPLHKAVSVDRLIGWEAFLELDPQQPELERCFGKQSNNFHVIVYKLYMSLSNFIQITSGSVHKYLQLITHTSTNLL